ncbi:hypothetical protein V6O07_18895, partial [Arthrospira platensis SPKY2]
MGLYAALLTGNWRRSGTNCRHDVSVQNLQRLRQDLSQVRMDRNPTNPSTTPIHYRACHIIPMDWQALYQQDALFPLNYLSTRRCCSERLTVDWGYW